MYILLIKTVAGYSVFIDPAYHYDSILSNEHAVAHTTLKERITIVYFDSLTGQNLQLAAEKQLTTFIYNVKSESSLSSNEISNKNITKTK